MKKNILILSLLVILCGVAFGYYKYTTRNKTVLLAILAKNKAHTLPSYLQAIENLDYDKKLITVYINTNNNVDNTLQILTDWTEKNKALYKHIELESANYKFAPETTKPHEWTPERFSILAQIREKSLWKAKEYNTDYYFVVDCDNFITPPTLKDLVNQDKPIIAPMLIAIPEEEDDYSNFFTSIDEDGYWAPDNDFYNILFCDKVGTFEVPCVHCTYLINTQHLDKISYLDDSWQHEFIVFSRSARENDVGQYITNEKDYGTLLHFFDEEISLEEEARRFQEALQDELL